MPGRSINNIFPAQIARSHSRAIDLHNRIGKRIVTRIHVLVEGDLERPGVGRRALDLGRCGGNHADLQPHLRRRDLQRIGRNRLVAVLGKLDLPSALRHVPTKEALRTGDLRVFLVVIPGDPRLVCNHALFHRKHRRRHARKQIGGKRLVHDARRVEDGRHHVGRIAGLVFAAVFQALQMRLVELLQRRIEHALVGVHVVGNGFPRDLVAGIDRRASHRAGLVAHETQDVEGHAADDIVLTPVPMRCKAVRCNDGPVAFVHERLPARRADEIVHAQVVQADLEVLDVAACLGGVFIVVGQLLALLRTIAEGQQPARALDGLLPMLQEPGSAVLVESTLRCRTVWQVLVNLVVGSEDCRLRRVVVDEAGLQDVVGDVAPIRSAVGHLDVEIGERLSHRYGGAVAVGIAVLHALDAAIVPIGRLGRNIARLGVVRAHDPIGRRPAGSAAGVRAARVAVRRHIPTVVGELVGVEGQAVLEVVGIDEPIREVVALRHRLLGAGHEVESFASLADEVFALIDGRLHLLEFLLANPALIDGVLVALQHFLPVSLIEEDPGVVFVTLPRQDGLARRILFGFVAEDFVGPVRQTHGFPMRQGLEKLISQHVDVGLRALDLVAVERRMERHVEGAGHERSREHVVARLLQVERARKRVEVGPVILLHGRDDRQLHEARAAVEHLHAHRAVRGLDDLRCSAADLERHRALVGRGEGPVFVGLLAVGDVGIVLRRRLRVPRTHDVVLLARMDEGEVLERRDAGLRGLELDHARFGNRRAVVVHAGDDDRVAERRFHVREVEARLRVARLVGGHGLRHVRNLQRDLGVGSRVNRGGESLALDGLCGKVERKRPHRGGGVADGHGRAIRDDRGAHHVTAGLGGLEAHVDAPGLRVGAIERNGERTRGGIVAARAVVLLRRRDRREHKAFRQLHLERAGRLAGLHAEVHRREELLVLVGLLLGDGHARALHQVGGGGGHLGHGQLELGVLPRHDHRARPNVLARVDAEGCEAVQTAHRGEVAVLRECHDGIGAGLEPRDERVAVQGLGARRQIAVRIEDAYVGRDARAALRGHFEPSCAFYVYDGIFLLFRRGYLRRFESRPETVVVVVFVVFVYQKIAPERRRCLARKRVGIAHDRAVGLGEELLHVEIVIARPRVGGIDDVIDGTILFLFFDRIVAVDEGEVALRDRKRELRGQSRKVIVHRIEDIYRAVRLTVVNLDVGILDDERGILDEHERAAAQLAHALGQRDRLAVEAHASREGSRADGERNAAAQNRDLLDAGAFQAIDIIATVFHAPVAEGMLVDESYAAGNRHFLETAAFHEREPADRLESFAESEVVECSTALEGAFPEILECPGNAHGFQRRAIDESIFAQAHETRWQRDIAQGFTSTEGVISDFGDAHRHLEASQLWGVIEGIAANGCQLGCVEIVPYDGLKL